MSSQKKVRLSTSNRVFIESITTTAIDGLIGYTVETLWPFTQDIYWDVNHSNGLLPKQSDVDVLLFRGISLEQHPVAVRHVPGLKGAAALVLLASIGSE